MAVIQITPEVLRGKAGEMRGLKSQHDETMTKMRALIMGLNETWKGDAQTAFVNKYESMQSTFTQFSEMLEGYAKQMDSSANTMEAVDKELAGANNA